MTELQAVNQMLLTIQEAPLNTLEGGLPIEASAAREVLANVSTEVQRRGWNFNTDLDVVLTQANDFTITVGATVDRVEFDPTSHPYNCVPVLLGRRVYDRYQRRYTFEGIPLKARRLIRIVEWDDLPASAQAYIVKRAAREFAWKWRSEESMRAAGVEEIQAYVNFTTDCNDNARPNMMSGPTGHLTLGRRYWRG